MPVLSPFALSLALPALLPIRGAAHSDQQSDEESIRSLVDHLIAAWNRHDAHAVAALFSSDAEFTNGLGSTLSGRAPIERFHAQCLAILFQNSRLESTAIRTRFLRSDVASIDVHWLMTDAGTPNELRHGLISLIMLRDVEHWEIALMHNVDLSALPAAPAA